MGNLLARLLRPEISRFTLSDYVRQREAAILNNQFAFSYTPQVSTYKGRPVEKVEDSYAGLAGYAYRGDSVVAACMRVRRDLFRQARFCWREVGDSGPGKIFRNDELNLLQRPWPNGTTGELLTRMITDVDLCGNSFILNEGDRLRWLRPDWVSIVLSGDPTVDVDVDVVGYVYTPGGTDRPGSEQKDGVAYQPREICHWSPEQDPMAFYRGMSWVSKALEEIQGDRAATTHKLAFFRNGATLGPIVRVPVGTTLEQFKEFVAAAEAAHTGAANAYRTMYVGGGAEITLAAADFRQLDLKAVQGAMETRIAAVAGVHPVLAGLSEGLSGSSLNSGNFAAARRATAEMTLFALWQDVCGALEAFVEPPDNAELWIREKDIPFLREDRSDQAQITQTKMLAIEAGMRAGFKPDPMVQAVEHDDLTLLVGNHTGLFSVQMQPPTSGADNQASQDYQNVLNAARADFDDEDEFIERRDYYNVRNPKGSAGGGRFRKISDAIVAALNDFLNGEGHDDPLADFNREQLRKAAIELGIQPRRGASAEEIKLALLTDARARFRAVKEAPAPSAKFTLQGPEHHNLDVAVYRQPGSQAPELYQENDAGKRGALVRKFDNLDELAAWADANGEPRLAEWARREAGTPAPAKATKKATPNLEQAAVDRQAAIDSARTVADTLAEVDQLVNDGASVKALQARLESRRKLGAPSDVVDELAAAARADQARIREVEVENQIRAAYRDLRPSHGFVELADLRKHPALRDVSRAEQDAALMRLRHADGVSIASHDQKVLTPRDLAAALDVGEGTQGRNGRHMIKLSDPSPVPVPSADRSHIDQARADIAKRYGLTPLGSAGAVEPFDPNRHEMIGGARKPRAGTPVQVVRPGHEADINGEKVQVGRAGVVAADAADMPVKAAKKAAPRAPLSAEQKARNDLAKAEAHLDKLLQSGDRSPGWDVRLIKAQDDARLAREKVHRFDQAAQSASAVQQRDEAVAKYKTALHASGDDGSLDAKILDTVERLRGADTSGANWLGLDELRREIGGTREQQDRALRRLYHAPGVRIIPVANTKALKPADRAAALHVGDSDLHAIALTPDVSYTRVALAEVSPSPAPAKAAKKAAPRAPKLSTSDIIANADLTPGQKRARLRARGMSKEEIDALVPLPPRKRAARSAVPDPDDMTRADDFDEDEDLKDEDLDEDEDLEDEEDDDEPVDEMDLALQHYEEGPDDDEGVQRAFGHDVTPGHDELHHYWVAGPGLAKWVGSPKPWTTLYTLVTEAVRKNGHAASPEQIKRWVSRWFIEVFHFSAGSDKNRVTHGHPPRGHLVGPG